MHTYIHTIHTRLGICEHILVCVHACVCVCVCVCECVCKRGEMEARLKSAVKLAVKAYKLPYPPSLQLFCKARCNTCMFVETYSYISIYEFGFDACRALHVCLQVVVRMCVCK